MKFTIAALFFIVVATSSPAGAQEVSDLPVQRPQRPPWEVLLGGTWLPDADIRGGDGELEMREVKFGFTRRFDGNGRLQFSTGINYTLRDLEAPTSARLPDSLHSLALQLGAEYRFSEKLTLAARLSPGLSSDFEGTGDDDFRVPVSFQAKYKVSSTLTTVTGLAYTGQSHSIPVLPVLGVTYLPSERWTLTFGFPRTAAVYKTPAGCEYFLAGEFSGGEYGIHTPGVGAEVLRYKDYRALLGAELPLFPGGRLAVSAGYAFGREFSFYEGDRDDLNLDNSPLARLEAKFQW
jgi:hypothetical protein